MTFLNPPKFVTHSLIGAMGLSAIAILGVTESAKASNIVQGSDYFISPAGFSTFIFDTDKLNDQLGLGLPAGQQIPIELQGVPIPGLLGNTDTVVQRQANAIFDNNNDGIVETTQVTIPIEMTQLSLGNTAPVDINGFQYNLLATLDPNTPTVGEMTINHNTVDLGGGQLGFDDTGAVQGTFDSFLDVFYQVTFTPIGDGPDIDNFFDNLLLQQTDAGWSHTPPADFAVLVPDPVNQDVDANFHLQPGPNLDDFFAVKADPDGLNGKVPDLVLHEKGGPTFPNGHGTILELMPPPASAADCGKTQGAIIGLDWVSNCPEGGDIFTETWARVLIEVQPGNPFGLTPGTFDVMLGGPAKIFREPGEDGVIETWIFEELTGFLGDIPITLVGKGSGAITDLDGDGHADSFFDVFSSVIIDSPSGPITLSTIDPVNVEGDRTLQGVSPDIIIPKPPEFANSECLPSPPVAINYCGTGSTPLFFLDDPNQPAGIIIVAETHTVHPSVPEPSTTLGLLLLGLGSVFGLKRRDKAKK